MKKKSLTIIFLLVMLSLSLFPAGSRPKASQLYSVEAAEMKQSMSDWTPLWAKKAVWYQIFPERFRNGDRRNDPKLEDQKGAWPHDLTPPWQVHSWTSDWYELQPYEKKNGRDIWFNIQRRRYGGDLQGIIDKLDYLRDLGVNALYINPVFMAPSLHKYDAIIYHHVDPAFGPDPEGDRKIIAEEMADDPATWRWTSADRLLLKLIEKAHQHKMRIILDGVFNHIGIQNPFFKDVVKNQQKSRYKEWFIITSWDNSATGQKFDYKGWFGIRELPEWNRNEKGMVEGPRNYIYESTRRWMAPVIDGKKTDGIDGWRLDVAFCLPHSFWKGWARHVRSINPEAYLTAEVIDSVEANKPYLEGDEFSAVMNYNFAFTCAEFFYNRKKPLSAGEFDSRLKELREAYAPCVSYVMQNLFDSHDTSRLGTQIVNANVPPIRDWHKYCEKAKGDNSRYKTRKPAEEELGIQRLAAIFQMTYLGAPMVYYGDEAGMWGANDPCCRKPMIWEDLTYNDEAYMPDGKKKVHPDKVSFNSSLFGHYKKLISIRNAHPALQLGNFKTLCTENDVYGFSRSYENEYIVILLNNGKKPRKCSVNVAYAGTYRDILNGGCDSPDAGNKLSIELPPLGGRILLYEAYPCEKGK
jgi:cyclomaltodextrinase / maltogenic alpha-amylase / neopullulanase